LGSLGARGEREKRKEERGKRKERIGFKDSRLQVHGAKRIAQGAGHKEDERIGR